MGFGFGFDLMTGLFPVMFLLVFGIIIVSLIKSVIQWGKNNASPVLTVEATVVAKRADVSHHMHADGNDGAMHHSTSTSYYVTFEVESGDRMELHVPSVEFGMLVEGDHGRLTFQGTRYHGFARYGVN